MPGLTAYRSVAALFVTLLALPASAADPTMTHVWRGKKTNWSGSCNGKNAHVLTGDYFDCKDLEIIGQYDFGVEPCNFNDDESADHYASSNPFPGSLKIQQMRDADACGCKESWILAHSDKTAAWGSLGFSTTGESFYAWSPQDLTLAQEWGLTPVYHVYSKEHCDNFYSEHPAQTLNKYNNDGYNDITGCQNGEKADGTGLCVAYFAADGWVKLKVKCQGAPNCPWKLYGPGSNLGQWGPSGTGDWDGNHHKYPSHKYSLDCLPVPGMVWIKPPEKSGCADMPGVCHHLSFFGTHTLTCNYACVDECDYAGQTQCQGNGLRICQPSGTGCLGWITESCSDGKNCTDDTCIGNSCVHTTKSCDHLTDQCNTGVCLGSGCTTQPKSGPCNDNQACTVNDYCSGGACVGQTKNCNDNDACTADSCSGGNCIHTTKDCSAWSGVCKVGKCDSGACYSQALNGLCNDGDACTTQDTCQGGECKGAKVVCPPDSPCGTFECDGGTCKAQPKPGACDDNDLCTVNDQCSGGYCVGSTMDCDDDNPCTKDACSDGVCEHTAKVCPSNGCNVGLCNQENGECILQPKTGPCDDGKPCTVNDTCADGQCVGAPKDCTHLSTQCADGQCVAGTCIANPVEGPCNDGKACTIDDACKNGKCGGKPKVCSDGVACTVDDCSDAGGCSYTPNDIACDDGEPCTHDSCHPTTGCTHQALTGTPCADGNPCTVADSCVEGVCFGGAPKDCTDGFACTADGCDPATGCTHAPQDGLCGDGIPCTKDTCLVSSGCQHVPQDTHCNDDDVCTDDVCHATEGCQNVPSVKACDDDNVCTHDTCSPQLGCLHTPKPGPCEDGSECTVADTCAGGICVPGPASECEDGNPCTIGACDPVNGCVFVAKSGACDDGDACTTQDLCVGQVCTGGPPPKCADGNLCTDDHCDPADGCLHTPNAKPCTDSNPCTVGDGCAEGACKPGSGSACDDLDPCTEDSCTPGSGACTHTPLPGCCATIEDCPLFNPACEQATCIAGECGLEPVCAENACGPNPCHPEVDCGQCGLGEVCIAGLCETDCGPDTKPATRCIADGAVLQTCVKHATSGEWYWKSSPCAGGEEVCAYSADLNRSHCCVPDCDGRECGKPSNCQVPCGTCGDNEYCCLPGQSCQVGALDNLFQCLGCCDGLECGVAPSPECQGCGTCSDGAVCAGGVCDPCKQANTGDKGFCKGAVAVWCDDGPPPELREYDCSKEGFRCCQDETLGHAACCDCGDECAEQGWQCGTNSCGVQCGVCPVGASCIEATHQCVCLNPTLCGDTQSAPVHEQPESSRVEAAEDPPFAADAGGPQLGGGPNADGGCGCRTARPTPVRGGAALLITLFAFSVIRFQWGFSPQ